MQHRSAGRVAEIVRYPVKGLGGEALDSAEVTRQGLPFDRAFGLTHDRVPVAPFGKWTTYEAFHGLDARADLAGHRARIHERDGDRSLIIEPPSGDALRVAVGESGAAAIGAGDAATISDWFATPSASARLVASGAHLWDLEDAPISLLNLATIRELEREAGATVDPRRFRANLFLDGLPPWEELALEGRRITVGSVVLEVLRPIVRCRAITVEPTAGTTDVNLLAVLGGRFGHIFCGMYARVVQPGSVTVGDPIVVGDVAEPPAPQDVPVEERASAPRVAEVVGVLRAGRDAVSVEVRDPAGLLQGAAPGQHVRLHRTTEGSPTWRSYTLSRVGPASARITVERNPDGRFSPWVHALEAGDPLVVTGPFGDATARDGDAELLLLTAGIGITPALAVADAVAAAGTGPAISAVHVARELAAVPHLDDYSTAVRGAGGTLRVHVTRGAAEPGTVAGRPDRDAIAAAIRDPRAVRVIVCGPRAFEDAMRRHLDALGVPAERVVSDPFYSPRDELPESRPAPLPGPFPVTFRGAGAADGADRTAEWSEGSGTLLDVAEASGVAVRAACRAGACGTCALTVRGETAYLTDPVFPPPSGKVLVCCAVPVGPVTVDPQ